MLTVVGVGLNGADVFTRDVKDENYLHDLHLIGRVTFGYFTKSSPNSGAASVQFV